MMMRRGLMRTASAVGLVVLLGLGANPARAAGPKIAQVEVTAARLRVSDVVKDAPPEVATADLGPSPAPNGSRVVARAELTSLLRDVGYTGKSRLPDAVRFTRKMRKLSSDDLEAEVRKATLPKGVTVALVRAPRSTEVPDGYDRVAVEVGKVARRAGSQNVSARVSFMRGDETLATVVLPIELAVTAEASRPDLTRGGTLTLLLRRGGIEISATAVAGADADVGAVLPVTVRATGRVVKAKLIEPARAVLVEAP